jgi:hypothetical protein
MNSPLLSCTHCSVHSCCANQSCAMLHAACAEGLLPTQPSPTRFVTVSITVNAMTCVIHGSMRSTVSSWNGIEQFFCPGSIDSFNRCCPTCSVGNVLNGTFLSCHVGLCDSNVLLLGCFFTHL